MTPAVATALCAPYVRIALLASMQFASSTEYVWTGIGPFAWNGMTFQGVGDMGSVSTISEDSNVEAKGITIELNGISPNNLTNVLSETRILGLVQIWLAVFDPVTGVLISDPVMIYQGKMDEPATNDGAETCICDINVENALVDLNRPCYRRYTNDDQQLDLAATLTRLGLPATTLDTGMRFVPGLQERVTFWGTSPSSINNV
jgi:hypothetical protein